MVTTLGTDPAEIKHLKSFMPHIERGRSFHNYYELIKRNYDVKIDLRDIILSVASAQGFAYFYDIGCGEGAASEDIFDVLLKRAEESGLDTSIVDNIVYVGIDLFEHPRFSRKSPNRIFHVADLRFLDKKEDLPRIDVGICYCVLPYIDRKVETLRNFYGILKGDLFVTPFFDNQLWLEGTEWRREKLDISNVSRDLVTIQKYGDHLIIKPTTNPVEAMQVVFNSSEVVQSVRYFRTNPITSKFGQRESTYRAL